MWAEFQAWVKSDLAPWATKKPFPAELVAAFEQQNKMGKEIPARLNEVMKRRPAQPKPAPAPAATVTAPAAAKSAATPAAAKPAAAVSAAPVHTYYNPIYSLGF